MTIKELSIQDTAQGLSLKNNLIGRDLAGNKYYLDVEIKPMQGKGLDVNHNPVTGAPVISISGAILSKYGSISYDRGWISAGQCLDAFSDITEFTGRWSAGELNDILAIWSAYHLNELNSHCAHQNSDVKWDAVEPCSVTGYKAGSAWLYAPIPDSVLITLTGLILKHRSVK
jgi:hypothetical protein